MKAFRGISHLTRVRSLSTKGRNSHIFVGFFGAYSFFGLWNFYICGLAIVRV